MTELWVDTTKPHRIDTYWHAMGTNPSDALATSLKSTRGFLWTDVAGGSAQPTYARTFAWLDNGAQPEFFGRVTAASSKGLRAPTARLLELFGDAPLVTSISNAPMSVAEATQQFVTHLAAVDKTMPEECVQSLGPNTPVATIRNLLVEEASKEPLFFNQAFDVRQFKRPADFNFVQVHALRHPLDRVPWHPLYRPRRGALWSPLNVHNPEHPYTTPAVLTLQGAPPKTRVWVTLAPKDALHDKSRYVTGDVRAGQVFVISAEMVRTHWMCIEPHAEEYPSTTAGAVASDGVHTAAPQNPWNTYAFVVCATHCDYVPASAPPNTIRLDSPNAFLSNMIDGTHIMSYDTNLRYDVEHPRWTVSSDAERNAKRSAGEGFLYYGMPAGGRFFGQARYPYASAMPYLLASPGASYPHNTTVHRDFPVWAHDAVLHLSQDMAVVPGAAPYVYDHTNNTLVVRALDAYVVLDPETSLSAPVRGAFAEGAACVALSGASKTVVVDLWNVVGGTRREKVATMGMSPSDVLILGSSWLDGDMEVTARGGPLVIMGYANNEPADVVMSVDAGRFGGGGMHFGGGRPRIAPPMRPRPVIHSGHRYHLHFAPYVVPWTWWWLGWTSWAWLSIEERRALEAAQRRRDHDAYMREVGRAIGRYYAMRGTLPPDWERAVPANRHDAVRRAAERMLKPPVPM